MKRVQSPDRQRRHPASVQHVPSGAELILSSSDSAVLVLRGGCSIRAQSGELERVAAGTLLLPAASKPLDRAVSRALSLLQAEPAKRWTVERLARMVGLSRAAFARRFVEQVGRPPLRFLTGLRLSLALPLLEADDASLAEVAARVGYASEFAFSRAFKRQHGVAPGVFRRLGVRRGSPITLLAAA